MPGMLDIEDVYMNIRQDDYPSADTRVLHMANFKKEKTTIYDQAQNMISQGLIVFPADLNVRNELTFTTQKEDGSIEVRYEKANYDEINALNQLSLLKEELTGIEKNKRQNGTVVFEQSIEAKNAGKHDDRADACVLLASELAKLREEEALAQVEKPKSDFKDMLQRMQQQNSNKKQSNPFGNLGGNPFAGNRKQLFT